MGIRSPFSSTRRMMNWPGCAFLATIGASISYRITVGFNASLVTMRYMVVPSFLFHGSPANRAGQGPPYAVCRIFMISQAMAVRQLVSPLSGNLLRGAAQSHLPPGHLHQALVLHFFQLPHHGTAVYTKVFGKSGVGHGQNNSFRLFFCGDGI